MIREKHYYRCGICGGVASRRLNVAVRHGYEDTAEPLLHVRDEDWLDLPHDVEPVAEWPRSAWPEQERVAVRDVITE